MRNYIPRYINDRALTGNRNGTFTAGVFFIDIVGFTSMTEQLMAEGKKGAETLSEMTNGIFSPIIDAVYDYGGYITGFAGDAFTTVFPGGNAPYAILAAKEIQNIFAKKGKQKTAIGEFVLSMRMGISYGEIEWGIVGQNNKLSYYFRGEPITESTISTDNADKGAIVITDNYLSILSNDAENDKRIIIKPKPSILIKSTQTVNRKIIGKFIPDAVINRKIVGEFRDVVPVFVSSQNLSTYEEFDKYISEILNLSNSFGGYINSVECIEETTTILVVFGAPTMYENNVERALGFALELKNATKDKTKIALTSGDVYAGIIGSPKRATYTVIGDTVNTAARLLNIAAEGQIITTKDIIEKYGEKYHFAELGSFELKGKADAVNAFTLEGETDSEIQQTGSGEFIGRDSELLFLAGTVAPLYSGEFSGVFYVYGDAGIGKSRLVHELTSKLAPEIQTIMLQTDDVLRKSLNPFVYAIKKYFHQNDNVDEDENAIEFGHTFYELISDLQSLEDTERTEKIIAELERTQSLLAALIGIRMPGALYDELDAKGRFENTIYAIKEFFKALSLIQPTIIVLEDLHWLDNDSHKAFGILTQNIEEYPLLIIATSRLNDDGSEPGLSLDSSVPVSELKTKSIAHENIGDLVGMLLGMPPDADLLAFIQTRTEGNPFYIEQFCLYLKETEVIHIEGGKYSIIKTTGDVPDGIRPVIIARLDRLSSQLRELVQTASVIGREFDIRILSKMLKDKDLDKLIGQGESEAIWSAMSEILYIFKHGLLRDITYEMQLRKQLCDIHARAGKAIETLYEDDQTQYAGIAFHYGKAKVTFKAIEYYQKAADFAKQEYRNKEFIEFAKQLLVLSEFPALRADINFELADTLTNMGEWDEAITILKNNIDYAEESYDQVFLAKNQNKLAEIYQNSGKADEALEMYEQTLRVYETIGDKLGQSNSLHGLGYIFIHKGDFGKALEAAQRSKEFAEEVGDRERTANAILLIGKVYSRQDQIEEGTNYYKEFLKISKERGDKYAICTGLNILALNIEAVGEFDEALELYEEGIEIARELGLKKEITRSYNNISIVFERQGNLEKALHFYTKAYDIAREMGDIVSSSISLMNVANINSKLGNLEKAVELLKQVLAFGKGMDEQNRAFAVANLAVTHGSMKKYDIALKYFREAEEMARRINAPKTTAMFLKGKTEILVELGEFEEAALYIEEALRMFEHENSHDFALQCRVLKAEIIGQSNPEAGIALMREIMEGITEVNRLADIYYRLYRITGEEEHRLEAIKIRKELIVDMPEYENIMILKELESKGTPEKE